MSTSTRACYEFPVPIHRRSPGKAGSQGFFGSAAIACLVVGCAWTVYANVFGASVYPALSSGNFDAPVIRRPAPLAARNLPLVADNSVIVESRGVRAGMVASASPADRRRIGTVAFIRGPLCRRGAGFGGAGAVPASRRSSLWLRRRLTPSKPAAAPAAQLALDIPLPAPRPAEARKNSGTSVRDMARRAKAAVIGGRRSRPRSRRPSSSGCLENRNRADRCCPMRPPMSAARPRSGRARTSAPPAPCRCTIARPRSTIFPRTRSICLTAPGWKRIPGSARSSTSRIPRRVDVAGGRFFPENKAASSRLAASTDSRRRPSRPPRLPSRRVARCRAHERRRPSDRLTQPRDAQ